MNSTYVLQVFKTLSNSNLSIGDTMGSTWGSMTAGCAVSTIPSTLHGKQDARVVAVEIVIMQILHHQQGSPIVLMCWHHYLMLHEGSIIQWIRQEVGSQVLVYVLLMRCSIAGHQPGWIIIVLLEVSLAPCLLLRAILINRLMHITHWVAYLCFVLSLQVLAAKPLESVLAHELHQLIICWDTTRFISILHKQIPCRRGRVISNLIMNIVNILILIRLITYMHTINYVLFSEFTIHCNFIIFILHFIEFFIPQEAFTVGPYHQTQRWLIFLLLLIVFVLG